MKKVSIEDDNANLRNELSRLKKENKSLSQKLDKSKCKVGKLQKELKKTTFGKSA